MSPMLRGIDNWNCSSIGILDKDYRTKCVTHFYTSHVLTMPNYHVVHYRRMVVACILVLIPEITRNILFVIVPVRGSDFKLNDVFQEFVGISHLAKHSFCALWIWRIDGAARRKDNYKWALNCLTVWQGMNVQFQQPLLLPLPLAVERWIII